MYHQISNLVFEGGGVLGIAYLGVLDYLYKAGIMKSIHRTAGTSAGAITACITSFNLNFDEIKKIADTLDYKKVPQKEEIPEMRNIPPMVRAEFERMFGNLDCIYRLVKNYGWYSSTYFYNWIKEQIAAQFDQSKKQPPYTFSDFKNPLIHQGKRTFRDLYVIGTDISYRASRVFCYETTPEMEVAQAVRISMSIPLFFEAVQINDEAITKDKLTNVFADGGVMRNYPINLFDAFNYRDQTASGMQHHTLGACFRSKSSYKDTNSLPEYISNVFHALLQVQQDLYDHTPSDKARSIQVDTGDISPVDFDISTNDETYRFLYRQGFDAARSYFQRTL